MADQLTGTLSAGQPVSLRRPAVRPACPPASGPAVAGWPGPACLTAPPDLQDRQTAGQLTDTIGLDLDLDVSISDDNDKSKQKVRDLETF